MDLSTTLGRLRTALAQPELALNELQRWFYLLRGPPAGGFDPLAADWDNLILLDACRYDAFRDHAELPGSLDRRRSRAPTTLEFLRSNLAGATLHDTVYVTANPQLYRIEHGLYDTAPIECAFHDTIEVWQDAWDEALGTVRPESVTAVALDAARRYPDKRLIVHYLQPHAPFIGPTGREAFSNGQLNFWGSLRREGRRVNRSLARRAYVENLEIVLDAVDPALEGLEGKTVITADHGELLGERAGPIPTRKYGHLRGIYVAELLDVPWYVHPHATRREVVAGTPRDRGPDVDDETVVDRLAHLGYA